MLSARADCSLSSHTENCTQLLTNLSPGVALSANTDNNGGMAAHTDSFSAEVTSAVRAEMGRQGKKFHELTVPLNRSYPTISSRLNGHTPFTLDELDKIAAFLGMTTSDLIDSANLGRRIATSSPSEEAARITPPQDSWAQPARSKKRRAS